MKRQRWFLWVVLVALTLACAAAWARPGGGSSFRGGSSGGSSGGRSGSSGGSSRGSSGGSSGGSGGSYGGSSGGSSGSSGGSSGSGGTYGGSGGSVVGGVAAVVGLVGLGVPLLAVALLVWLLARRSTQRYQDWNTSPAPAPEPQAPSLRLALEGLRTEDPNFSMVLFEDFLYALYAETHTSRGRGTLARMSAYVSPDAQATLTSPGLADVRDIVVGSATLTDVALDGPETSVTVAFETNYTEVAPNGAQQSYYGMEHWTLGRRRGVLSRTPDRARVFACPSCGAPLDTVMAGVCTHCRQDVSSGAFDWVVGRVVLVERSARGPMLTTEVAEEGTDLATLVDPNAASGLQAVSAKDPSFSWGSFQSRVALVFSEFQVAWAARDLAKMRPHLSDRLFQTQTYWVQAYLQQRLRNVTENPRIHGIELARVSSDRFYDAITVRLFASSLDYTLSDQDGRVVCGSRTKERRYTEYWTFIRGSQRKGPTRTELSCPNCGGPLAINMAGHCNYCQVKVTTGEFDWVLSKIEQDEVYGG